MIIQADLQFFAVAEPAKQAKYVKIFLKYHEMLSQVNEKKMCQNYEIKPNIVAQDCFKASANSIETAYSFQKYSKPDT